MQNRQSSGPTSATRNKQGAPEASASSSEIKRLLKSRVLHIRVTMLEEAAMKAAAETRDLRLAAFVRLAALHFAGAPTGFECDALGVNDAIRHLDGAANNLNQLARAANKARGIVMINNDRLVMAKLGDRIEDAQARFLTYRATAAKRPGQLVLPISGKDQ